MASQAKASVAMHRVRQQRQDFLRIEVNADKEDASPVRRIAAA